MKKLLIGVLVIIVVAVIGVGGYFAYRYFTLKSFEAQKQEILNKQFPLAGEPTDQTVGWRTYTDNYGFQMNYPSDTNVMTAPTSRIVGYNSSELTNSCPPNITPGYPDKTEKQIIGGESYCVYTGDDCGAGSCTIYYSYLIANRGISYALEFSKRRINDCKVYGSPSDAQKCESSQTAEDSLINQAVSTIKFTNPSQAVKPSIKVNLPPESACVWGTPCNITWQTTDITGDISITLDGFASGDGRGPYVIEGSVPVIPGQYSWIVPTYIPAWMGGLDTGGKYKIKICGYARSGTTPICGESDYLTIWQQAQ